MHRSLLFLVPALLGLAGAPFPQTPATASCAAPYLAVEEGKELRRGEHVMVRGQAFVDGCRDTMSCTVGLGCDSCEYDEPPERPLENVRLRLVQGVRMWSLGEVDAESRQSSHLGRVTWRFEVPKGVGPGPARLVPEGGEPVRVRIR
jgi:hypothetical protein